MFGVVTYRIYFYKSFQYETENLCKPTEVKSNNLRLPNRRKQYYGFTTKKPFLILSLNVENKTASKSEFLRTIFIAL